MRGFVQWSACLTAQRTALCSRARQRSPCDPGGRNMHETKRVVLVGLIAASFACAGAAAQEIKLTLADQNSPTGWGPSHALQPWVKQVEDATKGRVKIEVYPSQTLIWGRHVERHPRRHCRYRLVRAGLLAVVGRHVAAVSADQLGREGKRSALE